MEKRLEKRDVVLNKIKRTTVVIFIKKVLPIIIFLLVLIFSFVFGFWDVKNFEYVNSEFTNVTEQELISYLEQVKGVNIFLINPSSIGDILGNENGYIKSVSTKKVLPNKLRISFVEYTPFYSGYSLDRCILFSSEGTMILDICEDCEQECPLLSEQYSQVHITSNAVIESSARLIFYEEIVSIEKILSLYGYTVVEVSIEEGIAVFTDIEERTFTFNIAYSLDVQLSRLYIVCQRIDMDNIEFRSVDLRFERPVMKLK